MKKKLILLILISFIFLSLLYSQDKKLYLKSGIGYYADMLGWYDGPACWLEGSFRFNTGFNVNTRFSMAMVDWKISEGYFTGYKTILLREMIDITFSRPVRLRENHYLEPGIGFKLKREFTLNPDFYIQDVSGQINIYTSYSDIFYEIGFTFCLDYYYKFRSGFFLGARADTNIIWALGFEGLTVSPLVGFRF
jgi:hypothetical protein